MTLAPRVADGDRIQSIHPGDGETIWIGQGVKLREFVSKACGARGFSTGMAAFDIGAVLAYHKHAFSEAVTILNGIAQVSVEGRRYVLNQLDCIHLPAGVAHEVKNLAGDSTLVALSAFASDNVLREPVDADFAVDERVFENPDPRNPEFVVRFARAEIYELSQGAQFRDLFAGKFGSVGICGGYGQFQPGASLPCHFHEFDESITIIEGEAVCLVQGQRYDLSQHDTAFVPKGRPHRFINRSSVPMAMLWVYAGSDPERTLVDGFLCDGSLAALQTSPPLQG